MSGFTPLACFKPAVDFNDLATVEVNPGLVQTHQYDVRPVFARQGLVCDPADEMLSVVQLTGTRVIPVDCIPLKEFNNASMEQACAMVRDAFVAARSALEVTWRKAARDVPVPGWEVSTTTPERDGTPRTHRLDFILKHHGTERLNHVLRHRTREGAHKTLGLNLGPTYYSFMIRQINPW